MKARSFGLAVVLAAFWLVFAGGLYLLADSFSPIVVALTGASPLVVVAAFLGYDEIERSTP